MKTKLMTNAGDNYLICDCRENFTKTEMMNLLLQCRGINLVFLKNAVDSDVEINAYDAAQNDMEISVGTIMCAAEYLHEESSAEGKPVIKTHDMVHSVLYRPVVCKESEGMLLN